MSGIPPLLFFSVLRIYWRLHFLRRFWFILRSTQLVDCTSNWSWLASTLVTCSSCSQGCILFKAIAVFVLYSLIFGLFIIYLTSWPSRYSSKRYLVDPAKVWMQSFKNEMQVACDLVHSLFDSGLLWMVDFSERWWLQLRWLSLHSSSACSILSVK